MSLLLAHSPRRACSLRPRPTSSSFITTFSTATATATVARAAAAAAAAPAVRGTVIMAPNSSLDIPWTFASHANTARHSSSGFGIRRNFHEALVVGAGPAGVAAVGTLLQELVTGKVAWVDPKFQGGRINDKYREVPSNTKVSLFLSYAQAVEPFLEARQMAFPPDSIKVIEKMPQEDTCQLSFAADMVQTLTGGLQENERVDCTPGMVTEAVWNEQTAQWRVTIQPNTPNAPLDHCNTPLLVLCTGSSPTTVRLPVPRSSCPPLLDLDVALTPSILAADIPRNSPLTIGVVGASHSAILVLMNLCRLAETTHPHLRMRWFTRHKGLRYAVYQPDGWILYDNTGLKGEAATYARENLDGDKLTSSNAGRFITRVDCSGGDEQECQAMMAAEMGLTSCDYVVQAVGFTPNPIPTLGRDRVTADSGVDFEEEERLNVQFDHVTGGFVDTRTGRDLQGLFGAGIAFPERVVDKAGNVEYAVGLFKFMKFLKRVVPAWVDSTRRDAA